LAGKIDRGYPVILLGILPEKGTVMISSSVAYSILTRDMKTSLDRVASQSTIKRDAEYYAANINKIKDVDDFIGNYKVYSYAMTAYGLDDMTYAKAFMKKVLESDLTDPNSFANKLSDQRYKTFAAAFNFNTPKPDAQTDAQEDDLIGLYTQSFQKGEQAASVESDYFESAMSQVQNVDDLLGNSRLKNYVLKAFNIDGTYVSRDFISQVLTSDRNDPTSFVNTQANAKYQQMASYFNFGADGNTSGTLLGAQTAAQTADMGTRADTNGKGYFQSAIGGVANVDQLLADQKLNAFVRLTYGVADVVSDTALKTMLTDPTAAASSGFSTLNAAFDFQPDGSVNGSAQSAAQTSASTTLFDQAARSLKVQVEVVTDLDDLVANKSLSAFVKLAYGVPYTTTEDDFRKLLTDPAYAASVGAPDAASAFNFNADGSLVGGAQTTAQKNGLIEVYNLNAQTRVVDYDDGAGNPPDIYYTTGIVAQYNKTYYEAKIKTITNVDDLVSDKRMTAYIKSAFSLGRHGYGLGISDELSDSGLRQVLIDPGFANQLGLTTVYNAFNFAADGTVRGSEPVQSGDQMSDTMQAAGANGTNEVVPLTQAGVAGPADITEFMANNKLVNFYRSAYDIPSSMSNSDFQNVLLDPAFAAAQGYSDVHDAFNFNADGTVAGKFQNVGDMGNALSYFDGNRSYYAGNIGSVTSVDALIADQKLANMVKVAYNLPSDMSDADLKQALLDPSAGYPDAAAAFNFQADGTVSPSTGPQTAVALQTTSAQYMARYDDEAKAFIADITSTYKDRMTPSSSLDNFGDIKDIDDLLKDNTRGDHDAKNDELPDIYHVALQAFGLTEADLPKSIARKLLMSDAYDPKGYVASFKDERITNFARAFNFGSDGKVGPHLAPLSNAALAKYATNYKSHATMLMADGPLKDKSSKDATKAVDDFAKGMGEVKSLDDLLDNTKLTDFILKSVGLDPKSYDRDTLKKIFTSDPDDAKSYLNAKANSKFKNIVADFNFDTKGNLTRAKLGAVQDQGALERTQDAYLQQTLETQEGQTNDGTRLALYFTRKAPDITSLYSILGDKALFQVVSTAFSLPAQISGMDVDKQAKLLGKFVNLEDLGDPKKVEKLVKRFTAMYDIQNNTTQSPALQLLTGGGTG
jgi:hypothetical protein